MKFDFDLTTVEGRRNAIDEFSEAFIGALSPDKGEVVIMMYADGEQLGGGIAGKKFEISELLAVILAKHPEIIESTFKTLEYLCDHMEDDE